MTVKWYDNFTVFQKKKNKINYLSTYFILYYFPESETFSWYYSRRNPQSRVQTSNAEKKNTLQLRLLQYKLHQNFKSNLSIHPKCQIIYESFSKTDLRKGLMKYSNFRLSLTIEHLHHASCLSLSVLLLPHLGWDNNYIAIRS